MAAAASQIVHATVTFSAGAGIRGALKSKVNFYLNGIPGIMHSWDEDKGWTVSTYRLHISGPSPYAEAAAQTIDNWIQQAGTS